MDPAPSVVLLAAGKGTRMNSELPKVLHPICGRTMLGWVLSEVFDLSPARVVVVVGHGADQVEAAARAEARARGAEDRLRFVLQEPQNGTGHAVQVAASALEDSAPGVVLVLYGDMPLLLAGSMERLLAVQREAGQGSTALLSARVVHPHGYGRILRDGNGNLERIVEERDASQEERLVNEVNLGVYAFAGRELLAELPQLTNDNAQSEYYITDLPGIAVVAGRTVRPVVLEDPTEAAGVNSIGQLASARRSLQERILEHHMAAGVQIEDPDTTYIDHDVTIGPGTHVLPCTVIRGGVTIGAGCEVGPFTHLRVGTELKDGAEVGNFTECKKSTLGEGSKAKHLSYLGDAQIGRKTNIGAGTIFANYDGVAKHVTHVGDGAFIGSGTIVVAPNKVPDGATTGAGAVLTRSAQVDEGDTWVGMPARRFRSGSSSSDPSSSS